VTSPVYKRWPAVFPVNATAGDPASFALLLKAPDGQDLPPWSDYVVTGFVTNPFPTEVERWAPDVSKDEEVDYQVVVSWTAEQTKEMYDEDRLGWGLRLAVGGAEAVTVLAGGLACIDPTGV
jgi:hypothetical protein